MDVAMLTAPHGELAFRMKGSGPRVFLMHAGVFGDWFQPLWDEAGLAGLELIDYRRLGYAPSARPHAVLTIADHAADAAALLDHLGGRPATLVAHSSAGLIALDLTVSHPNLVRGLVLIEPALTDVPAHAGLGAQVVGPAMARFTSGDVSGAFETFMRGVCGADWRSVFTARLGPAAEARAVADAAWFFRYETPAILDWRPDADRLAEIACPVLLLAGAASDEVHPVFGQQIRRAAELLPRANVELTPGTHMAPLQYSRELAQRIARFTSAALPSEIA